MSFQPLAKPLIAHAPRAVAAFAKPHGDVIVSTFAFDTDPYNEADPDIRFARQAIAALSKKPKREQRPKPRRSCGRSGGAPETAPPR